MKSSFKPEAGTTRTSAVRPGDAGRPLVDFLAQRIGLSKKKAKQLLDGRRVLVNDRRVWMAKHVLQAGDVVELLPAPSPLRVDRSMVLHEDKHYLVVNKPAGILSDGPGSLEASLRSLLDCPGLRACHRLDRDTSGCLLFAKDERSRAEALQLFRKRRVRKTYRAIVRGRFPESATTVSLPIEGQTAVTHVRVLKSAAEASHLSIDLPTGRTHQIRRHLAALRHPVLGDKVYATGGPLGAAAKSALRQMLHAEILVLDHGGARPLRCSAPLPRDFSEMLGNLGLR